MTDFDQARIPDEDHIKVRVQAMNNECLREWPTFPINIGDPRYDLKEPSRVCRREASPHRNRFEKETLDCMADWLGFHGNPAELTAAQHQMFHNAHRGFLANQREAASVSP